MYSFECSSSADQSIFLSMEASLLNVAHGKSGQASHKLCPRRTSWLPDSLTFPDPLKGQDAIPFRLRLSSALPKALISPVLNLARLLPSVFLSFSFSLAICLVRLLESLSDLTVLLI